MNIFNIFGFGMSKTTKATEPSKEMDAEMDAEMEAEDERWEKEAILAAEESHEENLAEIEAIDWEAETEALDALGF